MKIENLAQAGRRVQGQVSLAAHEPRQSAPVDTRDHTELIETQPAGFNGSPDGPDEFKEEPSLGSHWHLSTSITPLSTYYTIKVVVVNTHRHEFKKKKRSGKR